MMSGARQYVVEGRQFSGCGLHQAEGYECRGGIDCLGQLRHRGRDHLYPAVRMDGPGEDDGGELPFGDHDLGAVGQGGGHKTELFRDCGTDRHVAGWYVDQTGETLPGRRYR